MRPPRLVVAALAAAAVLMLPSPLAAAPADARPSAAVADPVAHPVAAAKRSARPERMFVDPYTQSALAGPEFARLGRTPQARWFTDNAYPTPGSVAAAVDDYVGRARAARSTPSLVIYAVPDRDCGDHSRGGLDTTTEYHAWVAAAARALDGSRAVVVVEPDAVPLSSKPECGDAAERARQLAGAVRLLARTDARVYLDAGHGLWLDPATTARLLVRAGVAQARGFSTNVSNFGTAARETGWAREVRAELLELGVRDPHYVTDSSRAGAPAAAVVPGEWCNPSWARVGPQPRFLTRGASDGTLWIKPPGESDGSCNGGPQAGAWWPEGARLLLAD